MNATARIIDHAIAIVRLGVPAIEAIEIACKRIATTPVAQERARVLFLNLLARAERSAA